MNALGMTATQPGQRDPRDSMKSPLVASLFFHLFLILLFSGAFFIFSKPIEFPEEPMAVEILPVMEKASSLTEAPVAKKTKEPEEVSEEPPPMPKADEPKPVESVKPKPEPKEEIKPVEKPKEKPKEKVAEVAPKKAVPAPAKPKEEPKAEPVEEEAEFSSVLKNLVGDEAPPQPESVPRDTPRQAPQLTSPAPLGSQLSMSQMDALRAQLARCWNVLPGARDAATLVVDVEVSVSPAKIVQDARVVDQLRYTSDTFFRAAADSALRALRSPTCTPLELPDGKYDQWKTMTVRFDPKDMF